MRRRPPNALRVGVLLVATLRSAFAGAQAPAAPTLVAMPRALEIGYALSAAPAHLRDSAGVYVLDPAHGYIEARAGTNGFRCLVVFTEWNRPDLAFRDDIFVPEC